MSSNLKVNSLVPATGTEIGIGTTGGSIDFRCPATFGGNVTIGGTLTYDEVINIDSIGIVTARSGLNVQAGQLDVGSNIKLGNAGVVTATTFVGNGDFVELDVDGHTNLDNVSIAGVTTMTGNLTINSSSSARAIILPDNKRIYFGDDEDFWIGSNGSNGEVYGSLWFYNHQYHYDNVYARFGNGADLNIFHNGTNSFIDNNTGSLYIDSTDNIIFETGSSTERLRIDSNGKLLVGINTTSNYTWQPSARFAVESSGDASSIHFGQRAGGSADPAIMMLRRGGSTAWHHHVGRIYTDYNPAIYFQTSFATAPGSENFQTHMTMKHNAGVGIGTVSPKLLLHLHQENSNATFAHFTNTTTGVNANQGVSFGLDSNEDATIYHYGSKNIRFATGGTERVRIDTNGQLLVGTTTSGANVRAVFQGYNGGGENFQARVQFQTAQQTNLTTNQHLANLLFTNASSSTGAEIRVQADDNWGTSDYPTRISFLTAANGSAQRYERMIIKNDGVVNIGVASPQYAKKVNIQGDNGYTLSLSNQDYTGNAADTFSGIEGRIQCGGGIWASSGVRFVKDNGTSGDKHTRCELYTTDGYANKIGLVVEPDGEVSHPLQPSCTLYAPHAGQQINTSGDNVPIGYSQVEHNTRMTVSNGGSSDSTRVNSRIQVPIAGRYLISSLMSGSLNNSAAVDANDGIVWYLRKNGGGYSAHYNNMFGWDSLGTVTGQEFELSFTVVLSLAANDYLEVAYTNIHTNFNVNLDKGYFSVHKLS